MTIPNIISIIRIALVPAFCVLYFTPDLRWAAFIILVLSGISDVLDGMIARKFNLVSRVGKVLDPIADKLFQLSTVTCLCIDGAVGWWLLCIMIAKDLFMLIGGSVFYHKTHAVIASKWYGKLTSCLLFSMFVISFFLDFMNADLKTSVIIVSVLAGITMIFSIISAVSYTRAAVEINNEHKKNKGLKDGYKTSHV
ncbi:MAG: CDP-alcohol phosphatidyltransferase family protein [Clostridia bacterium]|nr:CDP-alcohol phosphatidyltransferase family protein [Clostridia bacterium]